MGFGAARFLLGVGEAANFPASIKTVAEWFPKSERAFSTGLFNAGTNVGAVRRADRRPVDCRHLGLARRLHPHRRARVPVGECLVGALSAAPIRIRGCRRPNAATFRMAPRNRLGREDTALAHPRHAAALGVRDGQAADRSDLVVLPLLASQVPRPGARYPRRGADPVSDHRLHRRRCRLGRRRLPLLRPHQARLDGERARAS